MPKEVWRPIPSLSGVYEASDRGRIRRGSRLLKLTPNRGYLFVRPSVRGIKNTIGVHRLVADAFLPGSGLVRHRNGDGMNNRLTNLLRGSQRDNMQDAVRHGTIAHGERHGRAKLSNAQALQILRRKTRTNAKQLAGEFGVSVWTVYQIASGRRWSAATHA